MFRKEDSSLKILRKLREGGRLPMGSEGYYMVERGKEGFRVRIKSGRRKVVFEGGWGGD